MYQAQWGNKGFLVSPDKIITLRDFSARYGVKSDDKNKSQKKNPHEMTIGVTYLRAAGTDPRKQYEEWCSYVGQSNAMYIGGKRFGPARMKLTDVQMSGSRIGDNGDFLSATLSLAFTEVAYTPSASRKVTAKATTVTDAAKTETPATTQAGSSTSKPTVSALKNTKGDFVGAITQVVANDPLTKAKKAEKDAEMVAARDTTIYQSAKREYENAVKSGATADVIDKKKRWLDTTQKNMQDANRDLEKARNAVNAEYDKRTSVHNQLKKAQTNSSKTHGGGGGSF